ncbi:MAG: UDP-N-acetylmuramoyl-L-alanine--D-glutamate ligase [Candidatus Melainabacteria bacterium HGW-Melainabacteria-1]|nr:MAG: UDP-N-acetylmuramoyl-L-alanine--D-glutamate ligase [Candidatus Melainabacteria bacterium HGW-Melainabacteria-1]
MPASIEGLQGMKVTIMGLGLHGGGLASAKFFIDRGASVTITDLRDETTLAPSIAALEGRSVRLVLGRHELGDFSGADIVIKNPAVKRTSPFLAAAGHIETDVSVFLRYSRSPIVAVTGSKGKSSTASAIYHGFRHCGTEAFLGGNITVSPLDFLDETAAEKPVVLELSSWQLADMRGMGVLKPKVAVLTAIMPDHMNYYSSMEEYVADKRLIYADQDATDFTICDFDSPWGRSFASETKARVLWYSEAEMKKILPETLLVPGTHMRRNLMAASLALRAMEMGTDEIKKAMMSFPGVEHRLEFFAESRNVKWYNDSASTIPDAVDAALSSFTCPVVLITGGTDKNIDFEPMKAIYAKASAIVLLQGTGTEKLIPLLQDQGLAWLGPYGNLTEAVAAADNLAQPGSAIVLSPGCASFGMFLHEFDRGKKFKEAVRAYLSLR